MGLIRRDHVKHDCQCCISCSLVLECWTTSYHIGQIPIDDSVIGLKHWQPQIQMGELSTNIGNIISDSDNNNIQQSVSLNIYLLNQTTNAFLSAHILFMRWPLWFILELQTGPPLSEVRISFMILWTLRWLRPIPRRTFNKNIIKNLIDESGFYLAFHLNK